MTDNETEIFNYAVKLLARRDYSLAKLREKLQLRFGDSPDEVMTQLIAKRFVNERRYAENYVAGRRKRGRSRLHDELLGRGIPLEIVEEVLSTTEWPSLSEVLKAKMMDWKMRKPLQPGDAARLFRAMARLGYEEEAIREEIQDLHEQQ